MKVSTSRAVFVSLWLLVGITGGGPAVARGEANGPAEIRLRMADGQSPLDATMAFFEKPLRFRGLLALAEEDDVASRLGDEELKNAAGQIRAISAAHKGR